MSDKLPEENNELAQVLNRINTLMKHGEVQAENSVQAENIPQLTEVYEGEPLTFMSRPAGEFPILNELIADAEELPVGFSGQMEAQQVEKIEALLAEMLPLIQAEVKKTVLQELVNTEQPLCAKIEAEIMQTLRERLKSLF